MADDDDRLSAPRDDGSHVLGRRARGQALVRLGREVECCGDRVCGLARAKQRARKHRVGAEVSPREPPAELLRLTAALRGQRAELIRLARLRFRVSYEVHAHAGSLCASAKMPGVRVTLFVAMLLGAAALVSGASGASTAATRLRIVVWPEGPGAGAAHRYTLACAPARGTVPRPARACRVLGSLGAAAFAPTPPDVGCTEIWGGPAKARVRGVVKGRQVDARLSLVDGCEIARWNRVARVVPQS